MASIPSILPHQLPQQVVSYSHLFSQLIHLCHTGTHTFSRRMLCMCMLLMKYSNVAGYKARENLHVAGVLSDPHVLTSTCFGVRSPPACPGPLHPSNRQGAGITGRPMTPPSLSFLSPYSPPGSLTLASTAPGEVLVDQNPACSDRAWMQQKQRKATSSRLDICTMNERVFPP